MLSSVCERTVVALKVSLDISRLSNALHCSSPIGASFASLMETPQVAVVLRNPRAPSNNGTSIRAKHASTAVATWWEFYVRNMLLSNSKSTR